jgi:hypothetical protein
MPAQHKTNTPHGQRGEVHREKHKRNVHHFKGRNFNHWNHHEQTIWRSGTWRHEKYMGRYGWWWMTGGMMYFYDEPVYPYPLEVPEIEYELTDDDQTSEEYAQPPDFDPNYWYYCEDPKGYYPYVTECPDGWMKVVPPPETSDQ